MSDATIISSPTQTATPAPVAGEPTTTAPAAPAALFDQIQVDAPPVEPAAEPQIQTPQDPTITPLPKHISEQLGKFKDVESLAKSYKELEKKLGQKAEPQAVAEYPADIIPEGLDVSKEVLEAFREQKLTPAQAKAALNVFKESIQPTAAKIQQFEQQEIARHWGIDLQSDVGRQQLLQKAGPIKRYALEMFGEEAARSMMGTAHGIKAIEAAMRGNQRGILPDPQPARSSMKADKSELSAFITANPDFAHDPIKRAQYLELAQRVAG